MRSSFRLAAAVALVAGGSVAAQPPASSPEPARNLKELRARAASYVAGYGEKVSAIVGVERYTQRLRGAGAAGLAGLAEPEARTLVSEFALVRAEGDWVGFRDVVEVDGIPVRNRRDRLLTLLVDGSREGLLEGRRIADESARYNLGAVQRNFNTPTMALAFLHPKHQDRFRFSKEGEASVGGTRVWRVAYRETGRPTFVRTPAGRSAPASGVFWIDPVGGRVFRTRMDLEAEVEQPATGEQAAGSLPPVRTAVSITVDYAPDARFGLLLPSEMRESYVAAPARRAAGVEPLTTITCVATYSDYKTFETFGRLIVR